MDSQVKLLIVVMDFYQAGGERFAYEVHKALNKDKFDISILSVRSLNMDSHFDDFYFEKHKQLGSKIYFLREIIKSDSLLNRSIRKLAVNSISSRLLNNRFRERIASFLKRRDRRTKNINDFCKRFDLVSWMGEYSLPFVLNDLDRSILHKSVIHLMNAKFQNLPYYQHYPKDVRYYFTSGYDDEKQLKYELAEFPDFTHLLFPLVLEIKSKQNDWKFKHASNKKIGIFTRLSSMKPLDVFFAAFNLLLEKMPKTELHIFGAGDPVGSGMKRLADNFGIAEKVFFRGHQRDIVQSAIKEELDLVWFQGYQNRPAGYAGFDICTIGIPQLFWDFAPSVEELRNDSMPYPNYKNLAAFVNKSFEVLTSEEKANELSQNQFQDVINNRNIEKHIHELECFFLSVCDRSKGSTVHMTPASPIIQDANGD